MNPIQPTIPLDRDGVHHGHLRLPYSRNDSAWGSLMIPLTVIRNGDGPTALLTGGNHGDEYEGPIALQALACELRPEEMRGRVIVVPYMNYPAFRAGTRLSPVDGLNLNRIFPGRPDGSPTEKIADYFAKTLVPLADVVLDFHSGGKTLEFLPLACAHMLNDPAQQAACVAAAEAFGAPWLLMLREIDDQGMYDTEVERQGRIFVTTELGGGGTTTPRMAEIARCGVRGVLAHAGILHGSSSCSAPRRLTMPGDACYHLAERDALFEPMVDLGETVDAGAVLGRLWPLDRTGVAPGIFHARMAGLVVGRHFPGLVRQGDCATVLAVENDPPS